MSDLIRNGISVAAMLIVGVLVGFRPDDTWWAYLAAAGLLMLFSFAFSWISAVIGLSVKTVEAAQSGGFIWLFPLTFCSTAFVPLDQLPSWMQGFAEYQPVSVTVTAVRGLTMDYPVGNSAWLSLAWSIGILAVFVPLAVRTYRRAAAR